MKSFGFGLYNGHRQKTAAARLRRPSAEITFTDDKGRVIWKSNPGPQTEIMWGAEFETLYGGARAGGKTDGLIMWIVRGNPDLPPDHPCFVTLLAHPNFTALILRRNATDLKELLDRADVLYGKMGGKRTGDGYYKWPHGPKIYFNHLDGPDAFEKYKGWNIPRIAIEELTLIPELAHYLKVLASCRTPIKELRPAWSESLGQILATTNPDGPGSAWVKRWFIDWIDDSTGKRLEPGKTILDPDYNLTRVFIPSRRKDNPFVGADYDNVLRAQAADNPKLARAWLDGDWDALSGSYFDFRRIPRADDPPEKKHVISEKEVMLMPWWPRFIGMDWGFGHETAVLWGCLNEADGRLHIYRELVVRETGTEEVGAEIARLSLEDLQGQPGMTIPMFLSHDAFNVQDSGYTKAEKVAVGIREVLGTGSVQLIARRNGQDIVTTFDDSFDTHAAISIRPSTRHRVDAWNHIRSLLRLDPIVMTAEPDMEYARRLLSGPDGFNQYEKYLRKFEKPKETPLPGMLVWDCCPKLIQEIIDAVHDPDNPEEVLEDKVKRTNDRLSALRYLTWGVRECKNVMPRGEFVRRRLQAAGDQNPGVLADPTIGMQVLTKAQNDYNARFKGGTGMRLGRASAWRN